MKHLFKPIAFCLLISMHLQACIFVAGAAAGAAAVAIVYDHRTIENTLQDTRLANRVSQKIGAFMLGHRAANHIQVTVFKRMVLLTGETPTQSLKQQVEEIAKATPGVGKVYNQITIEGPTSALTRTSDSWITAKIKGQMLANEDLKSGNIKVVTENGVVFLMGTVNQQQAAIAVDIARRATGVQKVIKVFQYTPEAPHAE